jgi:hypothetical protein
MEYCITLVVVHVAEDGPDELSLPLVHGGRSVDLATNSYVS